MQDLIIVQLCIWYWELHETRSVEGHRLHHVSVVVESAARALRRDRFDVRIAVHRV